MRSQAKVVSSLSVLHFINAGSNLSMRSNARIGEYISVLEYVNLASSLSVRYLGRVGSGSSILGTFCVQKSVSVAGFSMLSSSVSVRSFAVAGGLPQSPQERVKNCSLLNFSSMGSTFSLRCTARCSSAISM